MEWKLVRAAAGVAVVLLAACSTDGGASQPGDTPVGTTLATSGAGTDSTSASTTTTIPPPVDDRWFWFLLDEGVRVIALDPTGVTHELGSVPAAEVNARVRFLRLDAESALVISEGDDRAAMWLARRDVMTSVPLDPVLSARSYLVNVEPALLARDSTHVVLSFLREEASNSSPAWGELLWIDLATMQIVQVESQVYRSSSSRIGRYAGLTSDGRRVRYLARTGAGTDVRELTIATGEVRTLASSPGRGYSVFLERVGDSYYITEPSQMHGPGGVVVPVEVPAEGVVALPFDGGHLALVPTECSFDCVVTIADPLGGTPDVVLPVDAAIDGFATNTAVLRRLADGSLLIQGTPRMYIDPASPYAGRDPGVDEEGLPLLKITPDGRTEVLGYGDVDDLHLWLSDDGRYALLTARDGLSMAVHDLETGEVMMTMPRNLADDGYLSFFLVDTNGIAYGVVFGDDANSYSEVRAKWFHSGNESAWRTDGATIGYCGALAVEDGELLCDAEIDGRWQMGWYSVESGSIADPLTDGWFGDVLPSPPSAS